MSSQTDSREYAAMLGRLFAVRRAGIALELERVQQALALLGHPERQLRMIAHVGGSNGKGSTSAFVAAVLQRFGLRTGLFTSPHLSRFAERFRIAGKPAPEADILSAYQRLEAIEDRIESSIPLTFFERVTVIGLQLFASAGVEAAVLEVGLGGRFDATNVVLADVACVTGVALDHREYLGDDLSSIARAKAGIFKPGKRAVIGRAGIATAVPWLLEHARVAGAQARVVQPLESAQSNAIWPSDRALPLPGRHQRDNAACAVAIVEELQDLGLLPAASPTSRATIRAGLGQAYMPGRMEQLAEHPRVVVDGAHNPHAACMLADAVADWSHPRALVLGVAADKDVAGVARALCPPFAQSGDAIIATCASNSRSLPAATLGELVAQALRHLGLTPGHEPGPRLETIPEPVAALDRARELIGSAGTVVVAGSLFLVGDVRRAVLGEVGDLIPISDPP